jgi:hypothetical protein
MPDCLYTFLSPTQQRCWVKVGQSGYLARGARDTEIIEPRRSVRKPATIVPRSLHHSTTQLDGHLLDESFRFP